jgi:hypothetical protein
MTVLDALSNDLAAASERLARRELALRRRARVAAIAVTGVLALGGAGAAASSLWSPRLGDDRIGHPSESSSPPPSDQLAQLGVLRRAQTDADRGASSLAALRDSGSDEFKGVRTDYVRLLATGDKGEGFVLVPVQRYGADAGAGSIENALCLFAQDPADGFGISCFSTEQVLSGRALMGTRPTPQMVPGGAPVVDATGKPTARRMRPAIVGMNPPSSTPMQLFGMVPDAVASVQIAHAGGDTVTASVHDNFFDAKLPGSDVSKGPPEIRWLDASGRMVGP